jgi:hypothetical protein
MIEAYNLMAYKGLEELETRNVDASTRLPQASINSCSFPMTQTPQGGLEVSDAHTSYSISVSRVASSMGGDLK